jgi:hypothetical protein
LNLYHNDGIIDKIYSQGRGGFLTGLLPASTALQGGVEGGFMKIAIFLTGKPRPLGRGASLFTRPSILSGRRKTDLNDNINKEV